MTITMARDSDLQEDERPAVRMASALHLLTASALNGTSIAKACALLDHLLGIAGHPGVDPLLRDTCLELSGIWQLQLASSPSHRLFPEDNNLH